MTREWKPGDVAAYVSREGKHGIAFRCGIPSNPGWEFVSSDGKKSKHWSSDALCFLFTFRPLVVIDPKDESQLAALSKALVEAAYKHGNLMVSDNGIHESTVRLALENFADPKPEEPLGLGAVVEDTRGGLYVRSRVDDTHPWSGPDHGHYSWRGTEAVKVLSEGVTA